MSPKQFRNLEPRMTYLPPEVIEKLEAMAREQDRPVSYVIRQIVTKAVSESL